MITRVRSWRERRRAARRQYDERMSAIDDEIRETERDWRRSGVSWFCAYCWIVVFSEIELIGIVLLIRHL